MGKLKIDKEELKKAGIAGTKSTLHSMLLLFRTPLHWFLRFVMVVIVLNVMIEWSFLSAIGGILAFAVYAAIVTFYDYVITKTTPEGTTNYLEY